MEKTRYTQEETIDALSELGMSVDIDGTIRNKSGHQAAIPYPWIDRWDRTDVVWLNGVRTIGRFLCGTNPDGNLEMVFDLDKRMSIDF